ncbi:MAG: leucyl/phenylalanyl-tRNA--protein transferase [Ostreibacterium sp.]
MCNIPWFADEDIKYFPSPDNALKDPDGLLAIGGNLSISTLVLAYQQGIFPWFSEQQPIMWWSPSVRAKIETRAIHVSKNMKKLMRRDKYYLTVDHAFSQVVKTCASSLSTDDGRVDTWITDEMRDAYFDLFQANIAHSIEVYNQKEQLVGGLYGVFVRNCFCGESMFSHESNTSKLALIKLSEFLVTNDCLTIDCQLPTRHLISMGAASVSRNLFLLELNSMSSNKKLINQSWHELWQH